MLHKGSDAKGADDHGSKPVHYACDSGSLALVHIVCEGGADVAIDVRAVHKSRWCACRLARGANAGS